jgi:hypothetical protein
MRCMVGTLTPAVGYRRAGPSEFNECTFDCDFGGRFSESAYNDYDRCNDSIAMESLTPIGNRWDGNLVSPSGYYH